MPEPTCAVDECERSPKKRGWCILHYRRWQRHGDPTAGRPSYPPRIHDVCTADQCDRPVEKRELCGLHYQRWRSHGDANWEPTVRLCSIDGCERKHSGNGLCGMHYERLRSRGDVGGAAAEMNTALAPDRRCTRCHEVKDRDTDFFWRRFQPNGPRYPMSTCKQCSLAISRAWTRVNPIVTDADTTKRCTECGEMKPLDAFYRHRRGRFGRGAVCVACKQMGERAAYAANPELHRARRAAYVERNRSDIYARHRAWAKVNREKINKIGYRRNWRKRQNWVEDVDRSVVFARDGGICQICGRSVDRATFEVDHVIPISKGGEHGYANVQLAHPVCNRIKGAKLAV